MSTQRRKHTPLSRSQDTASGLQADLERILEENKKLLEQAQARPVEAPEAKPAAGRLQTLLPTAVSVPEGPQEVADGVFRLGAGPRK